MKELKGRVATIQYFDGVFGEIDQKVKGEIIDVTENEDVILKLENGEKVMIEGPTIYCVRPKVVH